MKSVFDKEFKKYGRVLDINVSDMLHRLDQTEDCDGVVYVASCSELESSKEYDLILNSVFGGMPIQIGYCNGYNNTLNAVEYHRDSEINITSTGAIFMLGCLQDVNDDFTYDTSKIEIFKAEAGTCVEFYGTTLHYAPCSIDGKAFKVAVILPKGTNTDAPCLSGTFPEDKLLTNKNKWLIAHKDAKIEGAFVGLAGENIKI